MILTLVCTTQGMSLEGQSRWLEEEFIPLMCLVF